MKNENDFRKWLDAILQHASNMQERIDPREYLTLRLTSDRLALPSFEDQLSWEDRQFLHDIGVAL